MNGRGGGGFDDDTCYHEGCCSAHYFQQFLCSAVGDTLVIVSNYESDKCYREIQYLLQNGGRISSSRSRSYIK